MRLHIDDGDDSNFDDKYFIKIRGPNNEQTIESERYNYGYIAILV